MKTSTDRILTTHAGSLPRPKTLLDTYQQAQAGRDVDEGAFEAALVDAVNDTVRRQHEAGIDVVDDGEMGKPNFLNYFDQRLEGFEAIPDGSKWDPFAGSREAKAFPEYYGTGGTRTRRTRLVCTGPIKYVGQEYVKRDIVNLRAAVDAFGIEEAFIPAISPSNIEDYQENRHYDKAQDYLFAIADAMREEYKSIVDGGFLVQIDDPRLVTYYIMHPEKTLAECREWCELRVEALNRALQGIPADRVRYHTCYSINMGPRVHDMELKDVVDLILRVNAGAYSFEAANPRHEHEWKVWRTVKLPDDKVLIPGVVTQSSVLVEHPELVADRILRFADVVGRERVIAGADCGFATFALSDEVHPSIAWAKLQALSEGARLASKELWK